MKLIKILIASFLINSFNLYAETPSEIYKNQTRIFDGSSDKVKEAIINFHRNKNHECFDGYLSVDCQGKGRERSDKYSYSLKDVNENQTEVVLIISESRLNRFFSIDGKITQNQLNAIEKQLLRDMAPSTPSNADGKIANLIIPITNEDWKDSESRRFSYSYTLVLEGIRSYFINQRKCGGFPTGEYSLQYRCRGEILGISTGKADVYNIEFKKIEESITDVRIRVDGIENNERMFKSILDHIKYLATKEH